MFDSENVILNHSVNYNKKNDSLCGDGNLEDYPLSVGRVYSESRATTTTTTTTTSSSPRHLRPCGSVRIHIYQVRVHVPTRRVTLGFSPHIIILMRSFSPYYYSTVKWYMS